MTDEENCYMMAITDITKDGDSVVLTIDFNSDEAIYIQFRNQIIVGIATDRIREGDSLPSVRQLADNIGINMHTVNKAYSVLRQEGFIKLDRRKGAVVALDINKMEALEEMRRDMGNCLWPKASAKGSRKKRSAGWWIRIYDIYTCREE